MPRTTKKPDDEFTHFQAALWAASDMLRGHVDAVDSRDVVLGLVFLKFISDSFEAYHAELQSQPSVNPEDRNAYDAANIFWLPPQARWSYLRTNAKPATIARLLNEAFVAIEAENPTLRGLATTDHMRLEHNGGVLVELIEILSSTDLNKVRNSTGDSLGVAYENLLLQFATAEGKRGVELLTPPEISELIANLVSPQLGDWIYDPACGAGLLLIKCAELAGKTNCLIFGQEANSSTSTLAKMNVVLHGIPPVHIEGGNALRYPQFTEENQLMKFDVVVTNPPFSLKSWGQETWEADIYGRNASGIPPKNCADYAWIQHAISSMKPTSGRAAIVMPHGVLFREGSERRIRRYLLEHDLLDAVIGLGPRLRYASGIPISVLIFRTSKDGERKGKVTFIDASTLFEKELDKSRLNPVHIEQITKWYKDAKDVLGAVRIASAEEIALQTWNLNIARYVKPVPGKLLEHAVISIRLGVDDFEGGEDDRIFSSIRNLYAGLLLLFKERLLRLSPTGSEEVLIKANMEPALEKGKVVFKGKGNRTIDLPEIEARFKSLGIEVDWGRVRAIQRKRNEIEHYYTTDRREAIREIISNTFIVIRDFIEKELGDNPHELLGTKHWNTMLKTSELYESQRQLCRKALKQLNWESSRISSRLEEIQCPSCGSLLLKPAESVETDLMQQYFACTACGQIMTYQTLEDTLLGNLYQETLPLIGSDEA